MKELLITGLSTALVAGSSACSSQSTGPGGNSGGGRVALITKTNSAEYQVKVKEGVETVSRGLGVDVSFNGPDTESEGSKQLNQLQSAINDKPLSIGFAPQDGAQDGAPALMDRAKESGVPVVILNAPLNGSDIPVATVASNNKGMGAQATRKLVTLAGDRGKTAIVARGEVGTTAARRDDLKEYLAKNTPELQVVDVQNGESDPAESRDKAQGILQAHSDLVGFFGTDDDSTITIADEVAAKNLQAKVAGADSSPDVIFLLGQGKISGIVVQNPYGIGEKMIELIVAASKGESPAGKNVISESVWVTTENLRDPDVQQIAD